MKNLYLLIAGLLLTGNVWAQVPQKMSYQAVIRNSSNALVVSTPVGMKISILQGSSTGTAVYVETQTAVTNTNGLVSLEIGTGTIVTGVFDAINWPNGPFFIKIETDPTGGTDYTIVGTNELMSVPYALFSANVAASSITVGFTHYIGELFGGGIVVAVWKENDEEHGLIASLTDLSESSIWSNVEIQIGIPAWNPAYGEQNTEAIVAQSANSAAMLCYNYVSEGYSDWYMPAIWELNQCYNAAAIVNRVLGSQNSFQKNYYWSSTEDYENYKVYVLATHFIFGTAVDALKSQTFSVRAVRRF